MTRDEALEYILGTTCGACGGGLAGPGEACGSCGRIPDLTGPELEGALDGPLALAAVEAAKARAEAWQMHDAAVARMAEADRAVFVARLHVRRDQAQKALDEHQRERGKLHGPKRKARDAEDKAAAELAEATRQHGEIGAAEETARRHRHGVQAETDAAVKLDKATAILRRYQEALAQATARREAAEAAAGHAAGRAEVLEIARDAAVKAVTGPGRIPLGGETITLGGLRLILRGQLDDVEMLIAGQTARLVCAATGVTAEIEADVRRKIDAENDQAKRDRPVHLSHLGDGNVSVAPNALHPQTPQPYHPPQYPAHPVQPAVTPRWPS
jgi:hypothetical protein